MPEAAGVWRTVRETLLREFKHAPLGTTGAIVATSDVAWRIFVGDSENRLSTRSGSTLQDHTAIGTPAVLPLLEFFMFQIVIAFLLYRLLSTFSRLSAIASVGLLGGLVAAYLTLLNAFYFARLLIETEGKSLDVFFQTSLVGFMFSLVLVAAFHVETCDNKSDGIAGAFGYAFGLGSLFVFAFIFFEPAFIDRLHPIWVRATTPHY